MSWFIFVGDMLVMLFMVVLVVWVFMVAPDNEIEAAGKIPLLDEDYDAGRIIDASHTETENGSSASTGTNIDKKAGASNG